MNEQLMAYLYGELSAEEKINFEEILKNDPALQEELREFRSVRSMMKQLEEVQPKSTVVEIKTKPIIPMKMIRWLSIAASLALLLWAGKPRLDVNKSGFSIAFGTPPNSTLVSESVDYSPIIQEEIARNTQVIYRRLDSIQQHLGSQQNLDESSLMNAIEKELAGYQSKQKKNLVRAVNSEYEQNIPRIVSNVQDMQLEQRRELRKLLNRMWQDVQRQREADLNAIDNALFELQRQQTSAIPVSEEEE